MKQLDVVKRYIIYILGLYIFALGIALVARSTLGATPVSSWAYTMSRHTNITYGTYSFLIHLAMIAYQVIILIGHGFKKEWYNVVLQLPFSALFGIFLDTNMYLTAAIQPIGFGFCLAVLLIACCIHSMGVFFQVSANVTMMSAEATVYYTCQRFKLKFWKTKIKFDVSMVILTIITSLLFSPTWLSVSTAVREGTVIDALLVGRIYHFYTKHMSFNWLFRDEKSF